MFVSLHARLRRYRRLAATGLAVLAVAVAAMVAHPALMGDGMDHHAVTDMAALCLTIGGSLAVVAVAAFTARVLAQRPLWLIARPTAHSPAFVPVAAGFLVRAGPSSARSQVFRL